MTVTDLAKSYVRTIVPAVVGAIIAWALHHGHDIHGYEAQLTVVITAVYYGVARLLEHYVSPRFGWLLGAAGPPLYQQIRTLKAHGGSVGHHTVQIHADTSQAVAALNEVKAAAEQASKAVAGVHRGAKRLPKAREHGYGAVEVLLIVLLVVVILVLVGALR